MMNANHPDCSTLAADGWIPYGQLPEIVKHDLFDRACWAPGAWARKVTYHVINESPFMCDAESTPSDIVKQTHHTYRAERFEWLAVDRSRLRGGRQDSGPGAALLNKSAMLVWLIFKVQ